RAAIASGALLYSIIIRAVNNENGRNTAGEHALITITDSTGGALFILYKTNRPNVRSDQSRTSHTISSRLLSEPDAAARQRPARKSAGERRLRGPVSQGVLHARGDGMMGLHAR